MRKRRVEPLSEQSRCTAPHIQGVKGVRLSPKPVTVSVEPSSSADAPSACIQDRVAAMSCDMATLVMTLVPPASAAAMMSRWA